MSPSPTARLRPALTVSLGLALALTAVACKPGASKSPDVDIRDWSLADIEAELDRNGELLADEGVMVIAQATPPTVATPPMGDDVGVDDVGGDEDDGADGGGEAEVEAGGDESEAPEIAGSDASPEMQPYPEPMSAPPEMMEEADVAYASEEGAVSRRRSRRSRVSSRDRRAARTKCERVCDLADAVCDLEAQICDLAERHPDEPRYAKACLRAEEQCRAAAAACERCED